LSWRDLKTLLSKFDIDYGDIVEIEGKRRVRGVVMPRSEIADDKHIVLKIDSGYNIGINIEDIEQIKKLGKVKKEKRVSKVKRKENLPDISLLSTGGTIASKIDYSTGAVHPVISTEELFSVMPELFETANISSRKVFEVLSENMNPEMWEKLAKEVYSEIKKGADAVVIAHGTDTMAYTGSALAFSFSSLSVPVVMVGSQRSSDRPSSDAEDNLKDSVTFAVKGDVGEVVVLMHGSSEDRYSLVHRAVKVRKMHSSRRDAFRTINDIPIAKIENKAITYLSDYRKVEEESKIETGFEKKVALLYFYPGMDEELFATFAERYKGIVIAGTGLGHVSENLIEVIKDAIEDGTEIVMSTQTIYGRVDMKVYSTGRKLLSAGVVSCEDMLPETALVKLSWLLDKKKDVCELMGKNLRGEITKRTRFDTFLT